MYNAAVFVELLINGIGTATWLLLLFALMPCDSFWQVFSYGKDYLIPICIAVAYVIGILIDRLYGHWFSMRWDSVFLDKKRIQELLKLEPALEEANIRMQLEKIIRLQSQALAKKIDYNCSRLTICRAWTLHFFLISMILLAHHGLGSLLFERMPSYIVICAILISASCCFFSWCATRKLTVDHQADLYESFKLLYKSRLPQDRTAC